jgi:hypothetical protein
MSEKDPYSNKKKNQNNESREMSNSSIPSDQGGYRTDDTTRPADKSQGQNNNSRIGGSQSQNYGGGSSNAQGSMKTINETSDEQEED